MHRVATWMSYLCAVGWLVTATWLILSGLFSSTPGGFEFLRVFFAPLPLFLAFLLFRAARQSTRNPGRTAILELGLGALLLVPTVMLLPGLPAYQFLFYPVLAFLHLLAGTLALLSVRSGQTYKISKPR